MLKKPRLTASLMANLMESRFQQIKRPTVNLFKQKTCTSQCTRMFTRKHTRVRRQLFIRLEHSRPENSMTLKSGTVCLSNQDFCLLFSASRNSRASATTYSEPVTQTISPGSADSKASLIASGTESVEAESGSD